jgi:large repetitive protein
VAAALLGGATALAARPTPAGPPQTVITFGPEGRTNLTEPVFAYESNDRDAQFECRVDSAPFAPCGLVEEQAVEPGGGPLKDGPHNFDVRAVNLAGVVDPTPARAHFIVDTVPPIAEFTGGPFGVTDQRRPRFTLRVSGESGFRCAVHGPGVRIRVRNCSGRHAFRVPQRLPDGRYEVTLLAFDRAENRAYASRFFTVRGRVARRSEVPSRP